VYEAWFSFKTLQIALI